MPSTIRGIPLKYLNELIDLNLPADKYAVFGSGPMAVRGLRDNKDIDLIVKPPLWNALSKIYPAMGTKTLLCGHLEIFRDWCPWFDDTSLLIDKADIFDKIRFVQLDCVLAWKRAMNRPKDRTDIELIEKYLKIIN